MHIILAASQIDLMLARGLKSRRAKIITHRPKLNLLSCVHFRDTNAVPKRREPTFDVYRNGIGISKMHAAKQV